MTTGQKVGTVIFRVIVGSIGLIILFIGVKFGLYTHDIRAFLALASFCGLTLGYAFAGDKWAARLFSLFSGHRVHIEEEPNAPISPHSDPSDSSSAR